MNTEDERLLRTRLALLSDPMALELWLYENKEEHFAVASRCGESMRFRTGPLGAANHVAMYWELRAFGQLWLRGGFPEPRTLEAGMRVTVDLIITKRI